MQQVSLMECVGAEGEWGWIGSPHSGRDAWAGDGGHRKLKVAQDISKQGRAANGESGAKGLTRRCRAHSLGLGGVAFAQDVGHSHQQQKAHFPGSQDLKRSKTPCERTFDAVGYMVCGYIHVQRKGVNWHLCLCKHILPFMAHLVLQCCISAPHPSQ